MRVLHCGLFLCLGSEVAAASAVRSDSVGSQPRTGPLAFVEWNPAALKDHTAQVNGEYLVLDGVAFGTLVKVRDFEDERERLTSVSLGATLTQYFFEETLQGLFLRGDASLVVDKYRVEVGVDGDRSLGERLEEKGYNTGLNLGLMSGYRAALTNHLTGSAGYGVVRSIPDFFDGRPTQASRRYSTYNDTWRFEVQVGLGVSF